jgi:hypothetical protein
MYAIQVGRLADTCALFADVLTVARTVQVDSGKVL